MLELEEKYFEAEKARKCLLAEKEKDCDAVKQELALVSANVTPHPEEVT